MSGWIQAAMQQNTIGFFIEKFVVSRFNLRRFAKREQNLKNCNESDQNTLNYSEHLEQCM